MKLELNDIHTLIGWVAETGLSLLEYEDAGMKIKIGGAAYGNGESMSAGNRRMNESGCGTYAANDRENSAGIYGGNTAAGMQAESSAALQYGAGKDQAPAGSSCSCPGNTDGSGLPRENSQLQAAAEQENHSVPSEDPNAFQFVESPLVGTFFAAPAEDAEPYVREGDTVTRGQVLGIVEAMKLMNEIEADCDGVVEEILVKNEQMVEYGQPLIKIRTQK